MEKEYYLIVIKVLDYIADGAIPVRLSELRQLAGAYYHPAISAIREHSISIDLSNGCLEVFGPEGLPLLRSKCLHALKQIEESEQDRELRNEESRCNIKYGKRGFIISIIAIIVSAISIVLSVL